MANHTSKLKKERQERLGLSLRRVGRTWWWDGVGRKGEEKGSGSLVEVSFPQSTEMKGWKKASFPAEALSSLCITKMHSFKEGHYFCRLQWLASQLLNIISITGGWVNNATLRPACQVALRDWPCQCQNWNPATKSANGREAGWNWALQEIYSKDPQWSPQTFWWILNHCRNNLWTGTLIICLHKLSKNLYHSLFILKKDWKQIKDHKLATFERYMAPGTDSQT